MHTKIISEKINKHVVQTTFEGRRARILMATDVHFDSKYCDRDLLKKHMDMAVETGSMVFFNGDLFDVMGCEKDPRSKSSDIRPEYISPERSYLDLVIEDVYEFLKPYKDNIMAIGYGNHETAIMKYRDTDPIYRLKTMLDSTGGPKVPLSGYKGVLKILNVQSLEHGTSRGASANTYIAHHHGYGGNARRSKGILTADIEIGEYPFADIIFSGHTHQKLFLPMNTYDINNKSVLSLKKKFWLKGGSYKDTSDKSFGFEVQKGFGLTVSGGWWIDIRYVGESRERIIKVEEAQ